MDTKKQSITKIKRMWSKIEYVLNNRTMQHYADQYLKLNREETKDHVGFKPYGVEHGLTITEEAKFFAVQRIAEYLYSEDKPDIKSYLHMVKSRFMAYALANEYKQILSENMTQEEADYFKSLDYCKFADVDEVF